MKGVDLPQAQLLIANAAVKSLRLQRVPMEDAWHLVLVCPAGPYSLHDAHQQPLTFNTVDDALVLLRKEGVEVTSLALETRQ